MVTLLNKIWKLWLFCDFFSPQVISNGVHRIKVNKWILKHGKSYLVSNELEKG